jgi:hypothetical protein
MGKARKNVHSIFKGKNLLENEKKQEKRTKNDVSRVVCPDVRHVANVF